MAKSSYRRVVLLTLNVDVSPAEEDVVAGRTAFVSGTKSFQGMQANSWFVASRGKTATSSPSGWRCQESVGTVTILGFPSRP
jgi:hypothetical protein